MGGFNAELIVLLGTIVTGVMDIVLHRCNECQACITCINFMLLL